MAEISVSEGRVVEVISFLNDQDVQARRDKGNLKTALAVETIESFARSEGLSGGLIIELVDLACNKKYNETISGKIIKSLIPQEFVPNLAILKVISWICTNTLSSNFQALLLRWVIVIYKLIDDISCLHSLYGILFLFLESDVLCPHTCLLLSLLTRQNDVKHFRIKKLLNLQSRVGPQKHLTGLLSVYKMFCPHLVSMATPSNSSWFKTKDKVWCEAVAKVQAKRSSRIPPERLFIHLRGPSTSMPKRRKIGVKPHPAKVLYIADMCTTKYQSKKLSVVELNNFTDLVENIDKIEFPSQIGSVLESPFLQHILCCNSSGITLQRLNFWLYQFLHQAFLQEESTGNDEADITILQSLIQMTCFLQESIPAMEVWLMQYLHTWNNEDYRTLILELIKYLSIHPFAKLNKLALEPLRKLFFASSVYVKSQVLCCYTELLRNFAAIELPRAQQFQDNGLVSKSTSIFLEEQQTINNDPVKTIYDFIKYVDCMCVVALQEENDHPLLQHCILNFFELVSVLHTQFNVPFVVIPSPAIVYRLFFAENAMACSRICQVIVNYRETFVSLKTYEKDNPCTSSVPRSGSSIQTLNQYILDISDSLWRNKAFLDTENSLCFSIKWNTDNLDIQHMNERFSVYHHPALIGYAWTFLQQTQPKDILLNPSLIKGNVRQAYLEYLLQMKVQGVVSFLETFIRQRKK